MDGAVIVSLFPSLFLGFLFTPITAPWSRTVFISLRSLTTVRASATLRVPFRYASLHLRYATDSFTYRILHSNSLYGARREEPK